jgi:hypothetical protein
VEANPAIDPGVPGRISQSLVPGRLFSSITQRARIPSGPGDVVGWWRVPGIGLCRPFRGAAAPRLLAAVALDTGVANASPAVTATATAM